MTAAGALLERLAPGPGADARATRGRAWLAEHGMPDRRAEAWRHTPLDEVLAAFAAATPAPARPVPVDRATVDALAGDLGGPRLVFVNGALVVEASDLEPPVPGLWLGGAAGLRPRPRPGAGRRDEPVDGFHALNWAAGHDVAAVLAEPGTLVEVPIHVVHLVAPADRTTVAHPRTVVRAGPGSRLHVVEVHAVLGDLGAQAIANASTRVLVGEEATVALDRLVDAPGALHIGRTGVDQAARSSFAATCLLAAGEIVRSAIDVRLTGERATTEVRGLHRPTGHERHDHVVTVDHAASHGTSRQHVRGLVDDHGRGSFSGHVIVRPGTVGTDADQANPNLVLAPTAQADTRPWLEIFADDVRCSHGATVGRLDDEALFYLRSRGIPDGQARAMLVAAFAAEIVEAIEPSELRERARAALGGLEREVGT